MSGANRNKGSQVTLSERVGLLPAILYTELVTYLGKKEKEVTPQDLYILGMKNYLVQCLYLAKLKRAKLIKYKFISSRRYISIV